MHQADILDEVRERVERRRGGIAVSSPEANSEAETCLADARPQRSSIE
jgi:hypothetical protein